jgi:hypothetical protein
VLYTIQHRLGAHSVQYNHIKEELFAYAQVSQHHLAKEPSVQQVGRKACSSYVFGVTYQ